MDAIYRYQRLIYDASRKFFLFGRDYLIDELTPPKGGSVLEIGCGTGRNLQKIGQQYPGCSLFGVDISQEMLRSARSKLGETAKLAQADATNFDPVQEFGVSGFDRVFVSFAVSMIPEWEQALTHGASVVNPGGSLHVVDFGTQEHLPKWSGRVLNSWLKRFHVTPRSDLFDVVDAVAKQRNASFESRSLYRSYSSYAVIKL
ncbi:MAG: class I SAM-dependent methyltransferase [Pseudomonadota bacterium]